MRLLIVEDEYKLAQSLQKILESERYVVDVSYDGEEGYIQGTSEDYDLIILDLNLPHKDGVTICQEWREEGLAIPIIMLTARDALSDRIVGLDAGADDYLVKPFEVDELLARIRALLRRQGNQPQTILKMNSLELDTTKKVVTRKGKIVDLSPKEYAMQEYFMAHPNTIMSKQQIIDHVWGDEVDTFSNVVDVYIGYVRKKIDKAFPREKPLLHTIKGMGYRLGDM